MSVTLTGFTLERFSFSALTPLLLDESWAAGVTLISAGVMFARAKKTIPRRVQLVTRVSVSVADAPTTDGNVFHRVVVPSRDRGILCLDLHHLSEQSLGPEKAESDVGRFGEILEDFGRREGFGRGSVVNQLHVHLSTLKRNDFGEFGGANDLVIPRNGGGRINFEQIQALVIRVSEVLPCFVGLSIVD